MQIVIIAFLAGSFVGGFSFAIARILYKSKVPEMCDHELCETVCKLRKEINLSNKERDIAIDDSMQTLRERNEALLMLSQKIK